MGFFSYQEPRTAEGAQTPLWIVDGQQRITALCLLLGRKPYWWSDAQRWNEALERYDVMVNLLPDESEDRLEFALPNPVRRRDPRWISIRRVLSMESVKGNGLKSLAQEIVEKIVRAVSNDPAQSSQDLFVHLFVKVLDRLHRLWQIREQYIPVIRIRHEVEDVAEIFSRLNRAGTRVKEADVILALAAVKNPGWVHKEYLPFRNELEDRGWDLDDGIFVRTMTGIGKGRARLREVPKDFWNPENFPKIWEDAKDAIWEVLMRRLAEFGITSADLLPSKNSLIPLFVLHHRWKKDEQGYRFSKALRWFLLANWDGRYSGSAITSLDEDIRTTMAAADFDQAIENLLGRLRVSSEIAKDEFLKRYDRAGSHFLRLMLYLLLFRREARDWVDGTRIGYDKTGARITSGFEPQWHHIYPRSVLRRANIPDDEIHCLANITVLNERTNVHRLSGRPPSRYIQEFRISEQVLRSHLIPDPFASSANDEARLKEVWDVGRYKNFLEERAKLLAKEANAFLQELGKS